MGRTGRGLSALMDTCCAMVVPGAVSSQRCAGLIAETVASTVSSGPGLSRRRCHAVAGSCWRRVSEGVSCSRAADWGRSGWQAGGAGVAYRCVGVFAEMVMEGDGHRSSRSCFQYGGGGGAMHAIDATRPQRKRLRVACV